MDPATATLIGALIGGTAALVGGWLAGIRQAKIEERKISLERDKLNYAQAAALNSEM